MPDTELRSDNEVDSPRLDAWLVVLLLSVVPMLASLAVRELVYHLAATSGILFAAGLAMLMIQERRRR